MPQTATLGGTVLAFSRKLMSLVETSMRRVAQRTAEAFGATTEVDFRAMFAPTTNDPAQAEFAAQICTELVGAANVDRQPPLIMASEDFSFLLEVPGCYINIGTGVGEGGCEVHNPAYHFH